MKMEHYLGNTDFPIWEVIQKGNGPVNVSTDTNGQIKVLPPKTAKVILARERERKARTTLLMDILEDHLARFHRMTDAKDIWKAIKSRFSGNDESKKMTKPGVDSLSFDDLYNNLRVFESDVKGSTGSSSSAQNVAFVSSESTSSTNDVSIAYAVSTSSGHNSQGENSSSYTDELILKKFYTKIGRKLQFDAKEPVGFNKTKVECFNCHKIEHFARECRSKGNQNIRRRDAWNIGYKDNGRRHGKQEETKALITLDGDGVDWNGHAEDEQENFALMAYSNSSSDTKREQLGDASIEIKAYTLALAKKLLAEAVKEKEELKTKHENFQSSSKGLSKLLNSQMSAKDKTRLGYGNQIHEGVLSYENEVFQSVFDSRSSDVEDSPVYNRFAKVDGMHVVPLPMTGIHMPPGPDKEIDESQFTYGPNQSKTNESNANTSDFNSCESNSSIETLEIVPEQVVNELKVVSQPKVWFDAPIIKEYESDNDDEYVIEPLKELKTPSFAFINTVKRVKTLRETVKQQNTCSQSPKVDKRNWNGLMSKKLGLGHGFTKKACFDDPHKALKNKGIVDSRCSRHMTGNKAYLVVYQDYNGGPVDLGGSKGYITGKGKIQTGKLDFEDMFFLPDENQVLFRVPRQNNMYSFNLENIVPTRGLACLIAKATLDESNKWHRMLGHVNFKNLNKLVKGNLVRGLPSKTFQNDHTYVACQKGKQHKASCKAKLVSSISQPLQLLHMDLFGPTSIRSMNHKTYCLVITDDFSRFSWVFFLRTKDETSGILKDFIRQIENQLNQKVKTIRCDNGTEFKIKDIIKFSKIGSQKPNWDVGSKLNEEPLKQAHQIFLEELERLKRQEKEANDAAKALRKEFAQSTEDLLLQAGSVRASSTKPVNTASTSKSIASPSSVFISGGPSYPNQTNYADQDDSQIPALEDIYDTPDNGIFTNASYDDEGVVIEFTNLKTAVNEELLQFMIQKHKWTDDTKVVVEDKGSDEKGDKIISTVRPEVSTARPDVGTPNQIGPSTTTTIFDDDEITHADTLIQMKDNKANGVTFKDTEELDRPARSIITLKPLPTINPKDKGKGVLQETKPAKKMTRSDFDATDVSSCRHGYAVSS
ncbi:putative ribonuclease H-like domain-containing protein [Tanacetum coccineum]|uniref:Ribonuclease H-like domain-containing protein n=1 Tax=Tanacetum coccineum TaxID=301880 RepID=A0ABQ5FQN2_9ASTR